MRITEEKNYDFTPNLRPIFKTLAETDILKLNISLEKKEIAIDIWQSPFSG